MARRRTEIDELAARIVGMRDADRAKLLARLIVAGGRRADWGVLREIRGRVRTRDRSAIERAAVQVTREVRRERAGMSTSAPDQPRATSVSFRGPMLVVELADGREVAVPVEWFPRLRDATPAQRANWELIGRGIGIHWPDVDEDLSVRGLLLPEAAGSARRSA